MTHSSGEGQNIDNLQVLVIAERAIADRICLRFRDKGMDIKVLSPPAEDKELSWLIHILFSDASGDDPEGLGNECSLFAWSRFDIVIVGDIWWTGAGESRARYAAGRVFAVWDNSRGNFSTRKIVLVTDADDFESIAQSALKESVRLQESEGFSENFSERIGRALDPKRSIALVNAGRDDFLAQLEMCIYSPTKLPSNFTSEDGNPENRERLATVAQNLTRHVIRSASVSLRKSIERTQTVIAIDDEQAALIAIYKALTNKPLEPPQEMPPELTVKILNTKSKETLLVSSFDELDKVSVREARLALKTAFSHEEEEDEDKTSPRDVVIVTDILFEIGDSTRTGIDIIQSLRRAFNNRIGIIAFTSFTTPFIAMAAYRQGADYVIHKDGWAGRHDSLRLNGFDRLVEALAILSFQRSYLRRVRQYCLNRVENLGADDELPQEMRRLIRLFERTMPQRTVSLHMQQEWEDTYWLLKTVQTGNGVKPEEAKVMLNEFRRKY